MINLNQQWTDVTKWDGSDTLTYDSNNKVLFFNSDKKQEIATYNFEVTDVQNFTFSAEIGNSSPLRRTALDAGYVDFELYDISGETIVSISTFAVNQNEFYTEYSLGCEAYSYKMPENAVSGAVIIKGSGNEKAPILAYFRNMNMTVNNSGRVNELEEYVPFIPKATNDAVRVDGGTIFYNIFFFAVLIVAGCCVFKSKVLDKKGNKDTQHKE